MLLDELPNAALSLAWLAAIFCPLEWARPTWTAQRRLRLGAATDLAFFAGQYLVFGSVALAAILWVDQLVSSLAFLQPMRAGFATWPLAVQAVAVVVLGDFAMYWGHRLQHRWEPLWRFHSVHHTTERLDFLAAHREHPLDGIYTQTLSAVDPRVDKANHLRMNVTAGATVDPTAGRWGTIEMYGPCEIVTPLGALHAVFGGAVSIPNNVELRFRAESLRPYSVECMVSAGETKDGETIVPRMTVGGSSAGTTWNSQTGRLAGNVEPKLGNRNVRVQICGSNGGIDFHMCNVIPGDRVE